MSGLNKFTAKEERLLLSLAMVVFVGIIFFYIVSKFDRPEVHKFDQVAEVANKWEVDKYNKKVANKSEKSATPKKEIKFSFNPNTVTKDSLLMLGVDSRTASNLIKYREKGGKIKTSEKFFQIYGMEPYKEKLGPLLELNNTVSLSAKVEKKDTIIESALKATTSDQAKAPGLSEPPVSKGYTNYDTYENPKKKPFKIVEINGADSTTLESVRGIGWYLANKIIRYRDRLGGFYSINQLEEIYGLRPESFLEIKDQFKIDLGNIKRININKTDANQLGKHPYIGKRFAEITILYRNNHGRFNSMEDVAKVKIFDQETLEKIKYYITFD